MNYIFSGNKMRSQTEHGQSFHHHRSEVTVTNKAVSSFPCLLARECKGHLELNILIRDLYRDAFCLSTNDATLHCNQCTQMVAFVDRL